MSGKLTIVPTPIGNLGDITLRALEVLQQADALLAEDTRTTRVLMQKHGVTKPVQSYHAHNEHHVTDALVRRMLDGAHLALVSDAGTPGISDPGFLLARACIQAGVEVDCLPGPTAFVPALVMSGFPCDRFIFEGFLPPKKGRQTRIMALAEESRTVVLYESPHRLLKTLTQLSDAFGPKRPAAVVREISKIHQEVLRSDLGELVAHFTSQQPRGEIVIIISGK